jgi:hypothetical protein
MRRPLGDIHQCTAQLAQDQILLEVENAEIKKGRRVRLQPFEEIVSFS